MDGSKIAQVAAERPFGTTSELHLLSVGFPFKQEQQVQEGVTVKCARVDVRGVEVSVAHLPFPCCWLPVQREMALVHKELFVFSCLT